MYSNSLELSVSHSKQQSTKLKLLSPGFSEVGTDFGCLDFGVCGWRHPRIIGHV